MAGPGPREARIRSVKCTSSCIACAGRAGGSKRTRARRPCAGAERRRGGRALARGRRPCAPPTRRQGSCQGSRRRVRRDRGDRRDRLHVSGGQEASISRGTGAAPRRESDRGEFPHGGRIWGGSLGENDGEISGRILVNGCGGLWGIRGAGTMGARI